MAERNLGERLFGLVKDIITAPVRNYRAVRIREQQADALMARDDLIYNDIFELCDLVGKVKDSARVLGLVVTTQRLLDQNARRRLGRQR